jgi:hypothetical protein
MSVTDFKIAVDVKNWKKTDSILQHFDILYDITKSKKLNGYSIIEFYSLNDYNIVTSKMNKYSIPYKDNVSS